MKKIITFLVLSVLLPLPALATDDFGTRFSGRTPTALSATPSAEDRMEDLYGKRLQALEPAAGEETPAAPSAAAEPAKEPEAKPAADAPAPQNEAAPLTAP